MNQSSSYPFDTILLNGREVKLHAVEKERPRTPFEEETLTFLAAWLDGENFFRQPTSGSTGTPKVITLSREQLTASAQRTMSQLPIQQGDTALVCLDTRYIAGKMMLVRALTHNLRIIAVEPSANPLKMVHDPVDLVAVVPYQLNQMLRESHIAVQHIKAILVGGAAVSSQLASEIIGLPGAIYATYGMTETASNIALQRLSGPAPEKGFRPLPGINIKVNEDGCLVIQVPEINEPVITNDVAEIFPDGTFRIAGRKDNVINSGGIKIFPESIEVTVAEILARFHISSEFFIGSLPHPGLGQQAVLIFEGPPLAQETEQLLLRMLRENLNLHAPRSIQYLPEFRRTPNGKIMRRETLALLRRC